MAGKVLYVFIFYLLQNNFKKLNKVNSSETESPFLDLHLFITFFSGIVKSKVYDKRDDFNFEIVIFPFLD